MDVRRRFLHGLASAAAFDPALLDSPGTVVVGTEDRAGSGAAVWYQAAAHTLIWCDPAVADRFASLNDRQRSIDLPAFTDHVSAMGFELVGGGDMRVLLSDPAPLVALPPGYDQRWLAADNEHEVDLVRAFTGRNSAEDVDEAALDDLDNFHERAINVLAPADAEPDHFIAYSSAADWEWDATFCDIGVLVDPAHRRRGLATLVVGHTVAALLADDRLPLYRHEHANAGSRRIADTIGFELATTLSYFAVPQ